MDLNLRNKSVLITGASKGIGKGVAMSMAAEGCNLHLVSRTRKDLEATASEIVDNFSVRVELHDKDLSKNNAVSELITTAGVPDILINNAGAIPAGTLEAVGEARWREAWDLKVFGYINMCRTFYAAMKERGHGVIINVTGLAADRTDADYIAGTTGNSALNAFTKTLGSRSLNDGIRVLSVSPGAVETERLVGLMRTRAEAEFGNSDQWQTYLSKLPLGRAASVKECAEVVTFMASDRAAYMSGTVVTVDGGHGANNGSFT
ncbi:short-chain dehydrogenase [Alphaproteobacteria bacterium 46_93_T64]|nr:short-chain dehydrogenase [Alphaproteobacteria bacterium 46_93_T64]